MAGIFSYAKTLWQDGVTAITAARLNHIEQGISDAADSIKTLGDSVSHTPFKYQGIIIDGSLNWDTLESGCAIVQPSAGLTPESHAPKNAYAFGTLITSNMGGGGDTRYQIYIPHQCQYLYVRAHWATAWTEWMKFTGVKMDS